MTFNVQEGLLLSCVLDTRALSPLGKLLVPFTVSMFLTPNHMHLLRWLCHRATCRPGSVDGRHWFWAPESPMELKVRLVPSEPFREDLLELLPHAGLLSVCPSPSLRAWLAGASVHSYFRLYVARSQ